MAGKASFQKTARVSKPSEFRSILKKGQTFRKDWVAIHCLIDDNAPGKRLGIVISKKWMRRASVRNRAKRIIREFFRTHQSEIRGGCHMVARVTKVCNEFKNNELREIIKSLFCKAQVLSD